MAIPGLVLFLLVLLSCQVLVLYARKKPELKNYQVVQPRRLFAQHKRDTQSNFPDMMHYEFHLDGEPLVLELKKTEDLMTNDYTETSYLSDDTPVTTSPDIKDHCLYQGNVKNDADSLVSVSACNGLSGMIHTRNRRYLIEPLNLTNNEHVLHEEHEKPKTCGVTNTTWIEGKFTKSSRTSSNAEKQQFLKEQKYIELYVVADNSMFLKYNRSTDIIRNRVFEMVNYINLVYKALNIFVALTGLEVWNNTDQFKVSSSAGLNLDLFCTWRRNVLLPRKQHDNAQFLTNIDFTGETVGVAFVGSLCSEHHSAGVSQDHNKNVIAVGAVIAHEMGHNLGMKHDTDSCTCAADSCIMSPYLSDPIARLFSSCSHQKLQEFILNHMPLCMKNKPNPEDIMTPPICGNKFTELAEDCDCGTVEECTNPCCDATTCKMKPEAKCAEGECCENCQIKEGGVLCRPSNGDCDLPDVCDGESPKCPADRFSVNGLPCKNGAGLCYNGKCPTRKDQCVALFGASTAAAEDSCYEMNMQGVPYGNCGSSGNKYIKCAAKDVKCGMLYCHGGSVYASVFATVVIFSNCKTIIHASGLVQDGTMCDDGKVCENFVCKDIESASNCSQKCTGHGVCDHEMKCQCEEGWAPPNCDSASSSMLYARKKHELKNYQVVQPRRLFAQHKRDTQSNFPDVMHYEFHLDGEPLVLDLKKTEDLMTNDYTETSYLSDDTPVTTSPDNKDHCLYQGNVKNDADSLVSVSACNGLSGMIHTRNRRYLIEPLNLTSNEHVLHEEQEKPKTCGVTNNTWTEGKFTKSSRTSSNAEKQQFLKNQKYIELYVVADNSMFLKYNRSTDIIRSKVFEMVNYVNLVYRAINIFVALTGLEVWNNTDQFKVSSSAGLNLDLFSTWRRNVLLPRKQHDNAQFLTNKDFTGATVGLAFVATLCSEFHSIGVIQEKISQEIPALQFFNLLTSIPYIQSQGICRLWYTEKTPRLFSSCSHQKLQEFILNHMPLCLKNKPNPEDVMTPPICGNKFTELGEDCDCGTVEECTNPYCDAATCKMKPEAKCVEGECCENCQIKEGGVLCRPSKDDCDLPDVCDGESPKCPADRFSVNGLPCKNGAGLCYKGKCPTRKDQCVALFGASTVAAEDSCYKMNMKGVAYGNCGNSGNKYIKCAAKDVKCGMLYCHGGSVYASVFATVVTFSKCKTVMHTSGLVENGTVCGDGMVCQNSVCKDIESAYRSSSCSQKCTGHAVCDHEMKCQCEEGWAPPNCDSASSSNITVIAVVVIIGVIAVIAVAFLVIFHKGKQRSPPDTKYGSTNPTFGVQNERKQPNTPLTTPEAMKPSMMN